MIWRGLGAEHNPYLGGNLIRVRVLTVWCSPQSAERCKLACIDMGGSQKLDAESLSGSACVFV